MKLPCLYAQLPYYKDSSHYFEAVRHLKWPVFLDSANVHADNARFDIIAADPFITLVSDSNTTTINYQDGQLKQSADDPFALLRAVLKPLQEKVSKRPIDLPFCGGAIGYFAYDLGRRIEIIPVLAQDDAGMPDMVIGIYDWAIISDHQNGQCCLASFGLNDDTHNNWSALIAQLLALKSTQALAFKTIGKLTSSLTFGQYQHAFAKIQHYIRKGDCYQVNLAQRFSVDADGDPWTAYKWLRQHNPAPLSAFFSTCYATLISSSPERLLQLKGNFVETRPIKGTCQRNVDATYDRMLAQTLVNSGKDQAENLMIVDLLRNDLGKVCATGSINVPKLFSLQSCASVHHLVSTITGMLSANQDAISLLRACFPGGSITGAPKLRAMEIIEELEPNRRGAYCGSIAYCGFNGDMDSNILIRTLVYSDNHLRFWAGGGIVADSQVDDEYQEIADKATAILALIDRFNQR